MAYLKFEKKLTYRNVTKNLLFFMTFLFYVTKSFAVAALDPTFGVDGKVTADFFGGINLANSLIIDNQGNIVLAGSATDKSKLMHFGLIRFLPNGEIDKSFGDSGKVMTPGITDYSGIKTLLVQPDDKLLGIGRGAGYTSAIMRFNPDGSQDATFGKQGLVVVEEPRIGPISLFAAALDTNGNILVTGIINSNKRDAFFLARYLPTGELDRSFGNDGIVIHQEVLGRSVARAITIDDKGSISLAGFTEIDPLRTGFQWKIVRYQENGTLDNSFGQKGMVIIPFMKNSRNEANAILALPGGKLLVGGNVQVNDIVGIRLINMGLVKLLENGTLDKDFGNNGITITDVYPGDSSEISALAVDSNGLILGFGTDYIISGGQFVLARYTPKGIEDTSFGPNGLQTVKFGSGPNFGSCIGLQSDGKIVTAGYEFENKNNRSTYALSRFVTND